jgi:hypothetical protein
MILRKLLLVLLLVASLAGAYSVVLDETQVYTRNYTPIECDFNQSITVWRELAVYQETTVKDGVEKTSFYSTITLFFRNDGEESLYSFFLKEHLPEAVAETPDDLIGFSIAPHHFEEGSVVVAWMFDNVEPGETKSVSYTVEKRLDEKILDDYDAPTVVAAGPELPGETEQTTDYTPIVLLVLVAIVGGLTYKFTR